MSRVARICCLLFIVLSVSRVNAQSPIPIAEIASADEIIRIHSGIEALEDAGHNISLEGALKSGNYRVMPNGVPNKNYTSSAYWFRFKVRNETNLSHFILKLANPALDSVDYYEQLGPDSFRRYSTGLSVSFYHREHLSSDYLFSVSLQPHAEKYIYLHLYTNTELMLPLSIGADPVMLAADKYKDIFWGIYMGIMLAMILYNCFVFSTTKDNSYLFYVLYMLTVVITQITVSGYAFQLLWPGILPLAKYSRIYTTVLAGITSIMFIRQFVKVKAFLPRVNKILTWLIVLYSIGAAICFIVSYQAGANIIDMVAGMLSIAMLAIAFTISRKGYRPAIFFFIAWIVFLIGVFIFIFKNFGILPYNNFTVYTMPVGSAMEALLLSFALADRINILKKRAEEAHTKEMLAVRQNERIVQEQNVMLENKVNERTSALTLSNASLSKTLVELKEPQLHLVESEKMASLGLLTAGIAHEINNPINFATSNIVPLNRDVRALAETVSELERIMQLGITDTEKKKMVAAYKDDIDFDYLKDEIKQLLDGIEDGVTRTAEIVKVLRLFSRLDEGDLKYVDINQGLDSTLIFIQNRFGSIIRLDKKYGSLPQVECYPGKLNQVFLNTILNAIDAVKTKFNGSEGGVITITTAMEDKNVVIKIADNGIGMDDDIATRIFEPFFTTKKVGEGVGLGLSIAINTVKQHQGQIQFHSQPGIGTEFSIMLPIA